MLIPTIAVIANPIGPNAVVVAILKATKPAWASFKVVTSVNMVAPKVFTIP